MRDAVASTEPHERDETQVSNAPRLAPEMNRVLSVSVMARILGD